MLGAVLSCKVLPLVIESLTSSSTLLLNKGSKLHWQPLFIVYPGLHKCVCVPGVSKPGSHHYLRKVPCPWDTDFALPLALLQGLCGPRKGTMQTISDPVRVGHRFDREAI